MWIHCSTLSVILNAMSTQYTCSLKVSTAPILVQWNGHCSHMLIPVHSSWLPGYMDGSQTILITLTMAGLFPDRYTHIYIYTHTHIHTHIYTYTQIHIYLCICIYVCMYICVYDVGIVILQSSGKLKMTFSIDFGL